MVLCWVGSETLVVVEIKFRVELHPSRRPRRTAHAQSPEDRPGTEHSHLIMVCLMGSISWRWLEDMAISTAKSCLAITTSIPPPAMATLMMNAIPILHSYGLACMIMVVPRAAAWATTPKPIPTHADVGYGPSRHQPMGIHVPPSMCRRMAAGCIWCFYGILVSLAASQAWTHDCRAYPIPFPGIEAMPPVAYHTAFAKGAAAIHLRLGPRQDRIFAYWLKRNDRHRPANTSKLLDTLLRLKSCASHYASTLWEPDLFFRDGHFAPTVRAKWRFPSFFG